jgi:hypothetical protein
LNISTDIQFSTKDHMIQTFLLSVQKTLHHNILFRFQTNHEHKTITLRTRANKTRRQNNLNSNTICPDLTTTKNAIQR